jgi:hypothetical protein
VIRAVAFATLVAALLAGCSNGSSGRQADTSAAVPTTTNDNSWSTFEAYVAGFDVELSRWQGSVDECLSGTSVVSCVKSTKHELEHAYDVFSASANGWLARPRLSTACYAKAMDVVTALLQRYAMLVTAATTVAFGNTDVAGMVDAANALAEEEEQSLNQGRDLCASHAGST